jgi:hypothetical protein
MGDVHELMNNGFYFFFFRLPVKTLTNKFNHIEWGLIQTQLNYLWQTMNTRNRSPRFGTGGKNKKCGPLEYG